MKKRTLLLLVVLFSLPVITRAQGLMVTHWPPDHRFPRPRPVPPPDFRPHPLTVKSIHFETHIENQVAKTKLIQVFLNETHHILEGTYFFPLPHQATISDFAIYEGEKKIRGEILEKDQARKTYQSIVRQVRDPGLLEYAGLNLFKASIFPIPANSHKKIELEYSQILKADSGLVSYVYPLGTGSRSQQKPIDSVSGVVHIKSPIPLKNIYSPTHILSTESENAGRATTSFENTAYKPTADFRLYSLLSDKEFGLSLLTHRESGEDGYFMMLLSPKTGIRSRDVSNKDIVFVIDVSGSMNDRGKIEKAQNALKFGISSLNEGDRFNIISFATEENRFSQGLLSATGDNKEKALRAVGKLRAAGGTNIYDALTSSLKVFSSSDRPRYLVFLTDGLPTVGETSVDRILKHAKDFNHASVRIFTFGVGYDVNTLLLDQLAATNNGSPDYITPDEDLEIKVSNFFEKINFPVLSNIDLKVMGLSLFGVYPKQIPDIFKGTQVSILGRYSETGRFTVRLRGRFLNKNREFTHPNQIFSKEATEADFLPRLWASRKVGYLLDQIRLNGESSELKEEVIRLAKKYGFVTPYTSYLAADDRERSRHLWEQAIRRGGTVTGVPGGVAGGIVGIRTAKDDVAGFRRSPREAWSSIESKDLAQQTGVLAVTTSQVLQLMKETSQLEDTSTTTQVIGTKLFSLRDEVWVDLEFEEQKGLEVILVGYGSEEYFDLLFMKPNLGKYMALGENVTFVFEGKVYKIRNKLG